MNGLPHGVEHLLYEQRFEILARLVQLAVPVDGRLPCRRPCNVTVHARRDLHPRAPLT